MIAAVVLAVALARMPLPLVDSGIDHGSRAGRFDAAPFVCGPDDNVAACAADADDDEL